MAPPNEAQTAGDQMDQTEKEPAKETCAEETKPEQGSGISRPLPYAESPELSFEEKSRWDSAVKGFTTGCNLQCKAVLNCIHDMNDVRKMRRGKRTNPDCPGKVVKR